MQEILEILYKIEEKVTSEVDFSQTIYESYDDLIDDIEIFIEELEEGNQAVLDDLYIHFLDHSTFNLLAISNGWEAEFKQLQAQYLKIVNA